MKKVKEKKIPAKLGKQDLDKFKKLLLEKKEKLTKEVTRLSQNTFSLNQRDTTGEVSGYTFHMADVASDNYDRDFGMGLASTEQKIIWEIDEALGRVKDKSFGICRECQRKITKKRLTVIPYARYCIKCAAKVENEERQGQR